MPSFSAVLLLFTLVALVSALSSPHAARNIHHHRHIAAPYQRRATGSRCKSRPTTVTTPTTTTTPLDVKPTPVAVKVHTTTTPEPKPKPTTTTTTSSQKPAPSSPPASTGGSNSNLPSYLVGTQTGQGTWYSTGLGACGITNTDSDFIAAVSLKLFDTFPGYNGGNPNNNPVCNKKIKATYQGKSVTIAVTDRCTGCAETDLDFSPSAFKQLADLGAGRISGVKWVWLD